MMYCFYLGLEKVEGKHKVKRLLVLYLIFEGHNTVTPQFHLSPLLLGLNSYKTIELPSHAAQRLFLTFLQMPAFQRTTTGPRAMPGNMSR
jgi:hypothetical protein